jgi:hypothetical protein
MQIRLTPALKGVITAILLIAVVLVSYYSGRFSDSSIQYLMYGIYGAGIVWTLIAFSRSGSYTGAFGQLFAQGFRCFIVVTLIMVTFTFVFNKMHPEFAEGSAEEYRKELIKNPPKDMLPPDIDKEVVEYKNNYNTIVVYGSIFGYLIIGAGVTAIISGLLIWRK